MSNTFCILPWVHLATNSSGNIRLCCNSTPGKNIITRDDGTPYNIKDADADQFWSSKKMRHIRKDMLEGRQPHMCERCFREEDAGVKSARQSWNEVWNFDYQPIENPPTNIKYVDIRLGNLCNLKCRMCNPYASNQWVDEWNLVESPLSGTEKSRLLSMNWFENDQVWHNISKYAHTIEEIYLTGGEPTLAVSQYKLFDQLIELDVAKKIKLKYNTNLTNIPKKMIEYWKNFKTIKINASIDAYGDLNRYIRFPTAWSAVEKNLSIFKEMESQGKCLLQIHTTVQMYNILRLGALFDFLKEKNITDIYLNILNHPDYLNIRCLPPQLKSAVTLQLGNYVDIKKVSSVIDYMNKEDWSLNLDKFYSYTSTLDQSRNQNLYELIPELKK